MEKRRSIEVDEVSLPEGVIQHIQSFLTGKQAARTSIISKSWHNAWLIHPNLDLDSRYFRNRDQESQNAFVEFAKKTMQRYQELNLKIESFRLCMINNRDDSSLAGEWIVQALKMGATKLSFEFQIPDVSFNLPHEVLECESLVSLSVAKCAIDQLVIGKVTCSKLKSLSLHKVCIQNDTFWSIIKSCPLIEKLLLSECTQLKTLTKELTWRSPVKLPPHFDILKSLWLERVAIDYSLFRDFSSKFPSLEDLTLRYCHGNGRRRMRISSRSLKWIAFEQWTTLLADFDVPNIRKFSFSGCSIPFVSFKTVSGEWESNISFDYNAGSEWFLKLKKFLKVLAQSKISLLIRVYSNKQIDRMIQFENDNSFKPVVEMLMVSVYSPPSTVSLALLDGLFWSCRPKVIYGYWSPRKPGEGNDLFIEFLCKKLSMVKVSVNCFLLTDDMCGLPNLHGVNVEFFEKILAEWLPLSWKILIDASVTPQYTVPLRFRLNWGASGM